MGAVGFSVCMRVCARVVHAPALWAAAGGGVESLRIWLDRAVCGCAIMCAMGLPRVMRALAATHANPRDRF